LKAEIIAIGNEILFGQVVDTNTAFIASELHKLGIAVLRKSAVADTKEELLKSLRESLDTADLVILTGGLGPTHDDITKKTVASFLKRRLILNDKVLLTVKNHFAQKGTRMPQVNTSQALVPQGAEILANPLGTAPGLLFEESYGTIILLPGVPAEMRTIFAESIIPYLTQKSDRIPIAVQTIHTTGIAESALYERLKGIRTKAKLAFLPRFTGVDIQVTVISDSSAAAKDGLKKTAGTIIDKLDDYYYGSDDESLERVIGILLSMRRKTVAVAESCTAGLLMKRITDVPGSSLYFVGGVVSYSNDVKVNILQVREKIIKLKGAVSGEVAKAMAKGIRNLMKADFGISITGIAGPGGSTENKPLGLVFLGFSDAKDAVAIRFRFRGTREIIREQAVQAALDLLRRKLLGLPSEGIGSEEQG
jgi:nicotinamide-nucleotide amidase